MTPEVQELVRGHRWALAVRWAALVASLPRAHAFWRDTDRVDRHLHAGLETLADAAAAGRVELFGEFAGRLSQEALALEVPLDDVIQVLLQVKPVILDFLEEHGGGGEAETIPFLNQAISAGLIEVLRRHERQHDQRQLAAQEQIDHKRERLRRQVVVDPATRLYSATYFAAALRREILRSRRFNRTFTLGLIALDQDDEIRESVGEEGLHAVITMLARILMRSMRQMDVRAALEGARFGTIAPETALEGAFALAERLRRSVERSTFTAPDHPIPRTYTVSIGLAWFPRDGEDDRSLLARAEEALARARAGRNTTVAAGSAQEL